MIIKFFAEKEVEDKITKDDIELVKEELKNHRTYSMWREVGITFGIDDEGYLGYTVNEPEKFGRLRRITGYLVGDLDRFNNAKRKEVEERVKHIK